jgi:hypothetical protein
MAVWLVWMRSRPKALRPLTSRSFASVPSPLFEPSFHTYEVLYLFLWLIIVYVTMVVYLLLSKFREDAYQEPSDFTLCTITQGLKLGTRLNAKSFSSIAINGISRLSDVLPKGNQL